MLKLSLFNLPGKVGGASKKIRKKKKKKRSQNLRKKKSNQKNLMQLNKHCWRNQSPKIHLMRCQRELLIWMISSVSIQTMKSLNQSLTFGRSLTRRTIQFGLESTNTLKNCLKFSCPAT